MWEEGKWNTGRKGDRDLEMLVQLHTGSIGLWPRMPKSYLADFADDDGKMLLGKDDGDSSGGGGGGGFCHSLLGPKVVVSKVFFFQFFDLAVPPKLEEDEPSTKHFAGVKPSFTQKNHCESQKVSMYSPEV